MYTHDKPVQLTPFPTVYCWSFRSYWRLTSHPITKGHFGGDGHFGGSLVRYWGCD